jgi:hypothetical protein
MSSDRRPPAASHPSKRNLPKSAFSTSGRIKLSWRIMHRVVLELDRILRLSLGIVEFSTNERCLLRMAVVRAKSRIALPSGAIARKDDLIIDLHFWNEHLSQLLAGRRPIARAKLISHRLNTSLKSLAEYVLGNPELMKAQFFHARVVMPIGNRLTKFETIAGAYGFQVITSQARGTERVHDFFERFLVRALIWAFNCNRRNGQFRPLRRVDLWCTRTEFFCRYLSPLAPAANIQRPGQFNRQRLSRTEKGSSMADTGPRDSLTTQ